MYQPVTAVEPAFQVAAWSSGRCVPRSPCFAYAVSLYSPLSTPATGPPPAIPHGPNVGARPGALQGLNLVQSALEPATALRFAVRYLGLLRVALMQWPGQRHAPTPCIEPSPGRPPLPSHLSHPIVQPDANLHGLKSEHVQLCKGKIFRRTRNSFGRRHRAPCRSSTSIPPGTTTGPCRRSHWRGPSARSPGSLRSRSVVQRLRGQERITARTNHGRTWDLRIATFPLGREPVDRVPHLRDNERAMAVGRAEAAEQHRSAGQHHCSRPQGAYAGAVARPWPWLLLLAAGCYNVVQMVVLGSTKM
jgi:hypothetical protein